MTHDTLLDLIDEKLDIILKKLEPLEKYDFSEAIDDIVDCIETNQGRELERAIDNFIDSFSLMVFFSAEEQSRLLLCKDSHRRPKIDTLSKEKIRLIKNRLIDANLEEKERIIEMGNKIQSRIKKR